MFELFGELEPDSPPPPTADPPAAPDLADFGLSADALEAVLDGVDADAAARRAEQQRALAAAQEDLRTYYRMQPVAELVMALMSTTGAPADMELGVRVGRWNRETNEVDDYYRRNLYAADVGALQKLLCDRAPAQRLEIGGVYPTHPASVAGQTPTGKLCAIDIDVDDWGVMRGCGCAKDMCARCARYVLAGLSALEQAIDALALSSTPVRFFVVYSGRRGAHGYLLDGELCATLGNVALMQRCVFMQLCVHDGSGALVGCAAPLTPALAALAAALDGAFGEVACDDHDVWRRPAAAAVLLSAIAEVAARADATDELERALADGADSRTCWARIGPLIGAHERARVVLCACAPRIDIGALHPSHLLKAPFAVHPATGRISVPILPDAPFDPTTAPTLKQALANPAILTPYIDYMHRRLAGQLPPNT